MLKTTVAVLLLFAVLVPALSFAASSGPSMTRS